MAHFLDRWNSLFIAYSLFISNSNKKSYYEILVDPEHLQDNLSIKQYVNRRC